MSRRQFPVVGCVPSTPGDHALCGLCACVCCICVCCTSYVLCCACISLRRCPTCVYMYKCAFHFILLHFTALLLHFTAQVSNRFLRHFNVLHVTEFTDASKSQASAVVKCH